jgi:Kef-type K+ transport system membrane component KefB
MQKQISDASAASGAGYAGGGVALAFVGGLFVARATGSDREMALSVGFLLLAVGLLGIVIGGVALGIQIARD